MQIAILVAVAIVLVASTATVQAERCRVLALSGGGDKGAYEAGVIYGLIYGLPEPEARWDVVTGISAGSINTGGLISYPLGQEKAAADFIVNTAVNLSKADIYQNWPLGIVQGLFETGLYDTTPLYNTLKRLVPGPYYRKFVIGATSYYTGNLVVWNETFSDDAVVIGMRASAAIPGIFDAVRTRNDLFGDGGVKEGVNILDGITRCLEKTKNLKEISVDVVLAMGYGSISPSFSGDTSLPLLMRSADIGKFKSSLDRIQEAEGIYRGSGLDFRYLIYPNVSLPGIGLEFKKAEMEEMVAIGKKDAAGAISGGPSSSSWSERLREFGRGMGMRV